MPASLKAIPDGYHSITPYLFIKGAAQAIEFYKNVFDAVERLRFPGPNGAVGHAEITINGSTLMLADEIASMSALSPQTIGGSPVMIHVYVPDVDSVFNKAIAAGARVLHPLEDKFYGDRSGSFTDPFGHLWGIATHKEDVSPEEMKRRAAALGQKAK